jgi:hypothetical protein
MPALILVTLLLAFFIFLAWFNSRADQPSAPARSSNDGPSWTVWSSSDAPSAHHETSDHDHGDAVPELHVEADDPCGQHDSGWESDDDDCSSDD